MSEDAWLPLRQEGPLWCESMKRGRERVDEGYREDDNEDEGWAWWLLGPLSASPRSRWESWCSKALSVPHSLVWCHRSFMATLDEDWGGFGHRASVTVYGGLDTWSLFRDLQWDLEYHVVFEPHCLSASRAGQLFFSMIFCTSDRALLPSTMWSASWAQDCTLHGTNFLLTQSSSEKEIIWLHWLGMSSSKRAIHE